MRARHFLHLGIGIAAWLLLSTASVRAQEDSDTRAIHELLDSLHTLAAEADEMRYLSLFAPDAVFMGTDDWERWPLPKFREYVAGRFAGGTGWTYTPRDRHLAFAPDGTIAWFDEIVESEQWGRFRGTGVVRRIRDQWYIAHYSLTLLVPNESFPDVATPALEGFRARDEKDAEESGE